MTIIETLQEIRSKRQDGDLKEISRISGVPRTIVSQYTKYAGKCVMKIAYVERIIQAWETIKTNKMVSGG